MTGPIAGRQPEFPKAGQPQIYAGTEDAPGGGKRLCFVQTHGQVPIHITVSKQDYETLLKDGCVPHGEEWCDNDGCPCYEAGLSHASEPPICREGR